MVGVRMGSTEEIFKLSLERQGVFPKKRREKERGKGARTSRAGVDNGVTVGVGRQRARCGGSCMTFEKILEG